MLPDARNGFLKLISRALRARRCPYRNSRQNRSHRRLYLEPLEDRTLLNGHTLTTATTIPFFPNGTAHASGFLNSPEAVDLYQVSLGAGDEVSAAVNTQASGSGLQSLLRVVRSDGSQVALDDREGGDPRLTFQVPAAGDYFLGVSSAGDDGYNPTVANSGHGGATTGVYALDLRVTPGAPLRADLTGGAFRLSTDTAAYGDTVAGRFTVENRGGADAGAFDVQVVLSKDNLFGAGSQVLRTFSLPGLGAGQSFSPGSFTVTLPDLTSATAADLPVSGPAYVGLRIDPAGAVPELNSFDQSGVHRGADWERLILVTPVTTSGSNHSQAGADVLGDQNGRVAGVLSAGQTDWYQVTVPEAERLTARVTVAGGSTFVPRVTLTAPGGQVLIQSDGSIVQHLPRGSYYLTVSAGSGSGSYQLDSEFIQARPPFEPISVGANPGSVAVADLDGDGTPDLVQVNKNDNTVSVLLGNGDGTFHPPETLAVGSAPCSVVVADLNGDGRPDLVVANYSDHTVSVLLGNGDGTFQTPQTIAVAVGSLAGSLAMADVNGDGKPDLVANSGGSATSVLLGNGDGTFQTPQTLDTGAWNGPVVADVNGDGRPDLIVGSLIGGTVSVLLGNGDGTFQTPQTVAVGFNVVEAVAVADVNGDRKPDLVVVNDSGVSVLLGNGDGTFQAPRTVAANFNPSLVASVVVADVNGDGRADLVVSNGQDNTVSVLLGNGDGTFQAPRTVAAGFATVGAVADLNGDGKPDLLVVNDEGVSVLLGNGDGSFQPQQTFAVGHNPVPAVVADLNGDGRPDLVAANTDDNTVTVLLGDGDGSFQPQQIFTFDSPGDHITSEAVVDVNGDGRPDLVVSTFSFATFRTTVHVLLGNGDGSFQNPQTVASGYFSSPVGADVNGDGKPDLAVPNGLGGTASVLLGHGDGTFGPPQAVAHGFDHVVVADVNGDGRPDLVVSNAQDNTVSVLLGTGDGTFQNPQTVAVGSLLAVADLNGDGKSDLVVAEGGSNGVSLLLGNGDGTFQPPPTFAVGGPLHSVAVADVNGDGKPDLIVNGGGTVRVLLGNGDGTFQSPQTIAAGSLLAVADVNGDGKSDLVVANGPGGTVSVLLGNGDSSFTPSTPTPSVAVPNTPHLTDLTGDGIPDSVILDRSGNILLRRGVPGTDNQFAPPVLLNPGRPARDLTVLRTRTGWAVATPDAHFDPTLSGPNQFVYTVPLYTVAADGSVTRTTAFSTTLRPTRIAAADLTGDGLDDLVVIGSLNNSIQVAFQQADGAFSSPLTLTTGVAPSDLSLVDVNGDGLLDIVVTNQASGDVSVFLNDPTHSFATSSRFRAGTGPYGLDTGSGNPSVRSLEQSVSLAAGDFTGDGRNDLVVVNRGAHSFTVLPNDGSGGFADPQAALATSTSDGFAINNQAGPVVAHYFHGPHQPLDLAILMEDRAEVWIYTGDGHGYFTHTFSVAAGNSPTGLSVAHNAQTGFLDLQVANAFGDVLILPGNGDGTFQPFRRIDSHIAVALVNPPGLPPYLIVANSGGNNVLVYPGLGNGQFGPEINGGRGFFAGTDPVGVTVADVNGDGIPDLVVANQGSNDVSVLFGQIQNGVYTLRNGPRLRTGGAGPVSTVVQDVNHDGIPDILVLNNQSNNVTFLPGVGGGFFDDRNPVVVLFRVGVPVLDLDVALVGVPVPDLDFALALNAELTTFAVSNLVSNTVTLNGPVQTINSGGSNPLATRSSPVSVLHPVQKNAFVTVIPLLFLSTSGELAPVVNGVRGAAPAAGNPRFEQEIRAATALAAGPHSGHEEEDKPPFLDEDEGNSEPVKPKGATPISPLHILLGIEELSSESRPPAKEEPDSGAAANPFKDAIEAIDALFIRLAESLDDPAIGPSPVNRVLPTLGAPLSPPIKGHGVAAHAQSLPEDAQILDAAPEAAPALVLAEAELDHAAVDLAILSPGRAITPLAGGLLRLDKPLSEVLVTTLFASAMSYAVWNDRAHRAPERS